MQIESMVIDKYYNVWYYVIMKATSNTHINEPGITAKKMMVPAGIYATLFSMWLWLQLAGK